MSGFSFKLRTPGKKGRWKIFSSVSIFPQHPVIAKCVRQEEEDVDPEFLQHTRYHLSSRVGSQARSGLSLTERIQLITRLYDKHAVLLPPEEWSTLSRREQWWLELLKSLNMKLLGLLTYGSPAFTNAFYNLILITAAKFEGRESQMGAALDQEIEASLQDLLQGAGQQEEVKWAREALTPEHYRMSMSQEEIRGRRCQMRSSEGTQPGDPTPHHTYEEYLMTRDAVSKSSIREKTSILEKIQNTIIGTFFKSGDFGGVEVASVLEGREILDIVTPEFLDTDLIHLLEIEAANKDNRAFDVYLDQSGSMASKIRVDGVSMTTFTMLRHVVETLREHQFLERIHLFDDQLISNISEEVWRGAGPSGGTDFELCFAHFVKEGRRPSILITDGLDTLRYYDRNFFVIKVGDITRGRMAPWTVCLNPLYTLNEQVSLVS